MTKYVFLAFLFYSFAALANENEVVSGSKDDISQKQDERNVDQEANQTLSKALCQKVDLTKTAADRYSFMTKEVKDPCSIFDSDETPEASTTSNSEDEKSEQNNPFRPISRAEAARKWGLRLATGNENEDFVKRAESFRQLANEKCCGGDQTCSDAMNGVKVFICQPPSDETQADPCITSPGSFQVSGQDAQQLGWNISRAIIADQIEFPPQLRSQVALQYNSVQPYINRAAEHKPVSGFILLSPYRDSTGNVLVGDKALIHEFGHACSSIQRQIQMERDKSKALIDEMYATVNWTPSACAINESHHHIYRQFPKGTTDGSAVESCLYDLAKQSANKESTAFKENACPAQQLEEGTAEAFAMLSESDSVFKRFARLCFAGDPQHPDTSHVLECVWNNSQSFRQKYNKTFCQPKG